MDLSRTLELLVNKEYLREEDVPKIINDPDFAAVKKGKKKKTTEERAGKYDEKKCDARIWKEGYDNIQCSFIKIDGECLCSRHLEKVKKDGPWGLGMVTEPRPENPFLIIRGERVDHCWRVDKDGNEVKPTKKTSQKDNEEPPIKKKRGRPKGSKNKKKKTTPLPELSISEIEEMIKKKKEEEEEEKEVKEEEKEVKKEVKKKKEKKVTIYKVDGVPYEIKGKDIMDPEDSSLIGESDGKGGIIFEDGDSEEIHKENVKKYENL